MLPGHKTGGVQIALRNGKKQEDQCKETNGFAVQRSECGLSDAGSGRAVG